MFTYSDSLTYLLDLYQGSISYQQLECTLMETLSEPVAMNRVPMYSMILVGAAFFKTEYMQMF